MQSQVPCEIKVFSLPVKVVKIFSPIKEKPTNYLQIKNHICKDTFHIGC